jgi:hypothetical protein
VIGHSAVGSQAPTALHLILGGSASSAARSKGIMAQAVGEMIRGPTPNQLHGGWRVGIEQHDVADLLTLCGIADSQQWVSYLALAQQVTVSDWWDHYSDVLPSWFDTYLGLSRLVSVIRIY